MNKYIFEIQSLIEVEVEAENVEDARMELVNDEDLYNDELVRTCYISDGIKKWD